MRRSLAILCCGIALVLAVTICFLLPLSKNWRSREAEAGQGRVRLLAEDIGNVAPKSRTKRDIAIKNDSSTPWTVRHIRTDCSCSTPTVEPARIEPGGIGTLSIQYDPPEDAGSISQKIVIFFLEQDAPVFICHITGFVEPWCYAVPREVDFGPIEIKQGQEPPTRIVVLRIKVGSNVNWKQSPKSPDWLDVSIMDAEFTKQLGEDPNAVRIRLKPVFREGMTTGQRSDTIIFQSAEDPQVQFHLPVRAFIQPPLTVTPNPLFLGTHQGGEKFTKTLVLEGRHLPVPVDRLFIQQHISVVHDFHDHLAIEVVPGTKPSQVDINCHFTIPDADGILIGEIKVSCQGAPTIAVPVSVKVRKSAPGKAT